MTKFKAAIGRLMFFLLKIFKITIAALRKALGSFSYDPPHWWRELKLAENKYVQKIIAGGRTVINWMKGHKKIVWSTFGVIAIGLMSWGGWYYYTYHMPHPEWTSFSVSDPEPKSYEEDKPNPVRINFERSVADLKLVGTTLEDGVTLSPPIKGIWSFENDSLLTFRPEKEWTPGESFSFTLDKKLFGDSVILKEYSGTFDARKFRVTAGTSEFYQHPTIPKEKKGVFTLQFNYPVEPGSLTDKISAELVDDKGGSKNIRFSIQYGKDLRTAVIHSEFLSIPMRDSTLEITVEPGVKSNLGGNGSTREVTSSIDVPGMFNYFKISDIQTTIIRDEKFEPEHVFIITTTAGARTEEVAKSFKAYLLPKKNPEVEHHNPIDRWSSPGQVTEAVKKDLVPIDLELIPSEFENSTQHTFRYKAPVERWAYLKIAKGLKSFGDYVLAGDYEDVMIIPPYGKELLIMHHGSILSLQGERKIPILSRNIDRIEYKVRRMRPTDLHHFITQSSGKFQNPHFSNSWSFSEENIAETFKDEVFVDNSDPTKTNYHSFDFTKYLNSEAAGGPRGVFFFSASARSGGSSSRFIVLTDLGIISKKSANGSLQVFIQSFSSGKPVQGARVDVLAVNGTSIFSEKTDSQGKVNFPTLKDFAREKRPVALIARSGNDYTFLPIGDQDRALNLQRFDIGGVELSGGADRVQAFVFTDRGIYRPGDKANFGVIAKNLSWKPLPEGLPLEFVITSPSGIELMKEDFFQKENMEDFSFTTSEESPTGSYSAQVYLKKKKRRSDLLGSVSFKVEEFLPDRMKILTTLSKESPQGWVKGDELKAKVYLSNLFGTPAQNREVRSEFRLVPAFPSTRAYPDYVFINPKKAEHTYNERLDTSYTNDDGEVELEIDLKKFVPSSYRMEFIAEGFEAEGGRSVSSSVSVYISPLDFVIGHKADGDLNYMKLNNPRKVHFIALNNEMKKTSLKGLKSRLIEFKYVSVLTKQSNGTYKYQSIRKEVPVGKEKEVNISEPGLTIDLDTSKDGNYAYVLSDKEGLEYAKVNYSVIAPSGLARGLERNAELQIALNKSDYEKGDEIELQIRAPYTGAGLITIERGEVYNAVWFRTNSETSIQKIKIPDELEGNGYVSVTFLRSMDSREIYTSPLSYGVAPFTISKKSRMTEISLKAPQMVRPGERLRIQYSASRPTSLVLYGVDEGILQVASYKLPDPLSFFFTKRALQVQTSQILDLLLPEFSIFQSLSATGGDEGSDDGVSLNLNPFKRKRDKPVAFWSGVINADKTEKVLEYEVPDYFNGSVRLMAVAASPDAVGNTSLNTTVRGDFVLSPNIPLFVTPGDEFEVSLGVSNTATGSGVAKDIKLTLKTSEHLEILSDKERTIEINEGSEKSEKFRLKAKSLLGSAAIKFTVEWNGKSAKSSTDLSLRPAIPYMTDLKLGLVESGSKELDVSRKMHDEYRKLNVSASLLPLTLADGLMNYLEKYPYGCTEQILSKAFPTLVLSTHPDFKVTREFLKTSYDTVLKTLRRRQTSVGSFGLWDSNRETYDFPTLYALHYLTEAKEQGLSSGNDLLERGLGYLRSGSLDKATSLHTARLWAYSLYLQARNAIVPKRSLESLRGILDANFKNEWKTDLTGVYVAGTYALLQMPEEGLKIIQSYKRSGDGKFDWNFFYDRSIRESQYLYIAGNHFPEEVKDISSTDLVEMLSPLMKGNYTTTNSSYAILGLDAYVRASALSGENIVKDVNIFEMWKGGESKLQLSGMIFPKSTFSEKAETLRIQNPKSLKVFYQTTQAGFDLKLPEKTIQDGMEIQREYLDLEMKPLTAIKNGDEIWVRLRSRTISDKGTVDNVAIVDLLPGGFEVVAESIRNRTDGPASSFEPRSVDIREDRVLVFGTINSTMSEYLYKIKATNVGKYVVPPPFAEAMYDRTIKARGLASKIEVSL